MSDIPVQNLQLPNGFCPADLQSMLNGFSAAQFVNIDISSSIVVSATTPPASDHDKAWLQLDSQGRPVRLYFFAQGAWLSQHPLPPGFTMIWNQALPNFQTFDGGDANAAPWAPVSGQMWQLMATTLDGLGTQVMQAQFPIGVGTLPSGVVVPLAGTGGEENHKLTLAEMFPHTHTIPLYQGDAVNHADRINTTDETTVQNLNYQSGSSGGDPTTGSPPTDSKAHNNMPPFYGVYLLQRTNRLFYLVPP